MDEQFNNKFNENQGFDENKDIHEEVKSEMNLEEGIPAMVKTRGKKSRGKGIALTLAVALASFGAGSLYTSHSWIQDQMAASQSQNTTNNVANNTPNSAITQTGVNTNGNGLSVAEVANLTAASVVEITTETVSTDLFMRQYVNEGAGSGVIISSDGYIATNNHVIDGASKITVRLTTGEEYEAKLIGTDAQTDVAVIKVQANNLKPVTYGNSDSLVVGETAIAIGNPLGQLGGTVTNGIISALDREIAIDSQTMTLLQTNAAINPGNSGGGLFNSKGELIGLVVAKAAESNVEGLGFAIPVNVVKEVVNSIIDVGYVKGRPVLGVSIVDVTSAQQAYQYGVNHLGVYIVGLTEGTKAEKSGLKAGDLIMAVDDMQISSSTELKKALQEHQVGDTVKVTVSRDGKLMTLQVQLAESVPTASTTPETPAVPSEN